MSALPELDAHLEAIKAKVTKSRIAAITTLCVDNVKSELGIVNQVYGHLQRSQPQQKLGILYAVDAVIRQWMDRAASAGQDVLAPNPQDGTFAGGVRKMTELLPAMMTELIQSAPDDQKDKIGKLVEIWERGNVFPPKMVADFKVKLAAREQLAPPAAQHAPVTQQPHAVAQYVQAQPVSSTPLTNSVASHQAPSGGINTTTTPAMPAQGSSLNSLLNGSMQGMAQPVNSSSITPEQATSLASVIPPEVAADPEKLTQYLKVLEQLVTMGVPPHQWNQVIQALNNQQQQQQQYGASQVPQPQATVLSQTVPQPQSFVQPTNQNAPPATQTTRRRSRSRSPAPRRGSPVYNTYQNGGNYRQRSPMRGDNADLQDDVMNLSEPKWTEMDPSLAEGTIKVLSRTLFVGGVACSEDELRRIFSRYGKVQTAIVNGEKRHAFVKMCTRAEAVAAKEAMEDVNDPSITSKVRKTRWGVGFGPRECNNYDSGISIVPIDRLTDADRKWAVSADYGGTGGKPLVSGMVMEEPDIEIGAGVSSKAISARRGTGNQRGNDRDRRNHGNSPAQRNGKYNAGSAFNDRRQQNNNAKLPPKPTQHPAPPAFTPLGSGQAISNFGQASMSLPTPTSTGFINTSSGVPVFGANTNMMQFPGMGTMGIGMNMGQGMNFGGSSGQGYR